MPNYDSLRTAHQQPRVDIVHAAILRRHSAYANHSRARLWLIPHTIKCSPSKSCDRMLYTIANS